HTETRGPSLLCTKPTTPRGFPAAPASGSADLAFVAFFEVKCKSCIARAAREDLLGALFREVSTSETGGRRVPAVQIAREPCNLQRMRGISCRGEFGKFGRRCADT